MATRYSIRAEQTWDVDAVDLLYRQAFGGADEAEIVRALREQAHPFIALVAESEEAVAGHIVFTPVTIEGDAAQLRCFGLGPMAVLPSLQRQGIGSTLVRAGLEACGAHHATMIFVLGHPAYYPRFGFRPAAPRGYRFRGEEFDAAFFVLELEPTSAAGRPSRVHYHPAFDRVA